MKNKKVTGKEMQSRKTLGTNVDESVYWEFSTLARLSGETKADRLKRIIIDDLLRSEIDMSLASDKTQQEEKSQFKDRPATQKQKDYIEFLCKRTDEKMPIGKLTMSDADDMIHKLKEKLSGGEGQ